MQLNTSDKSSATRFVDSVAEHPEIEAIWSKNTQSSGRGIIIGVDLGTSNTVCAVWHPGKNRSKIIKVQGRRLTPSSVSWGSSWDDCKVGSGLPIEINAHNSKKEFGNQSSHVVSHVSGAKLVMGQTADGIRKLLQSEAASPLSRNIHINEAGLPIFNCRPEGSGDVREISPEEVCAAILRAVRTSVEDYLFIKKPIFNKEGNETEDTSCYERANNMKPSSDGDERTAQYALSRVVIGVPAAYTEYQKSKVRAAALLAGFRDIFFCVESTAAAVAYGLGVAGSKILMTVDVGGGTSDVTILQICDHPESNKGCTFQVLCSAGATRCGGLDMDSHVLLYAVRKANDAQRLPTKHTEALLARLPAQQIQRLLLDARAAREALTVSSTATLRVPVLDEGFPAAAENAPTTVEIELTPACLDRAIAPVTNRLASLIQSVIQEFRTRGTRPSTSLAPTTDDALPQVDEVVLVGGCTLMPSVRAILRQVLHDCNAVAPTATGKDFEFCCSIDPHEAVAHGLAVRGAVLMGVHQGRLRDLLMLDALPHAIGILLPVAQENVIGNQGEDTLSLAMVRREDVIGAGNFFAPNVQSLQFHSILARGARIPSISSCTFPADASVVSNACVTLCIVEQKPAEQATAVGAKCMQYEVVGTYDFPVPTRGTSSDGMQVKVRFSVDEEGELGFSVLTADHDEDPLREEHQTVAGGNAKFSQRERILIMYIACMLVLYVWIKASSVGSRAQPQIEESFHRKHEL